LYSKKNEKMRNVKIMVHKFKITKKNTNESADFEVLNPKNIFSTRGGISGIDCTCRGGGSSCYGGYGKPDCTCDSGQAYCRPET
jgi:hypothetical protein